MRCSTLHFGFFVLGVFTPFTPFATSSPVSVHSYYLPLGSPDEVQADKRSPGRVEIHGHGHRPHTTEYIDLPTPHLRAHHRDIVSPTTPTPGSESIMSPQKSTPASIPPYPASSAGLNHSAMATGSLSSSYTPVPSTGIPIPDSSRSNSSLEQCGDQRYSRAAYVCYDGKLCPLMNGEVTKPCGPACYLPRQYRCKDGMLENNGQAGAGTIPSAGASAPLYPNVMSVPPNQTPTSMAYPTPISMPANLNFTPPAIVPTATGPAALPTDMSIPSYPTNKRRSPD